MKHLESSKSPTPETDGIMIYILYSKPDSTQIVYTKQIAETKFSNSKSDGLVNGKSKGVELLNIQNLENQSKTGSTKKNSGSSLVPGQNGEVVPVKKVDWINLGDWAFS